MQSRNKTISNKYYSSLHIYRFLTKKINEFYFSPSDFKGEFQFSNVHEGFLLNNNSTLKIEGDFGTIIYGNKVFNTYEINFKSPSEHTIGEGNVSFPLELQISSTSEDNLKVNIAILFSLDSQDSIFLYKLGFGKIK